MSIWIQSSEKMQKKLFGKRYQIEEQCSSWKNNGKCKKTDIKLVSTKARRKYVFTSKPVYFGVAVLEISRIVLYEVWYDYVKL